MKTPAYRPTRFIAPVLALFLAAGLTAAAHADDLEDRWSLDKATDLSSPDDDAAYAAEADTYKARLKWQDKVVARLQTGNVPPAGCDRLDPCGGGKIILSFSVDPDGRIFDQTFVRSSKSPARDTAALATLNRVDPLPAPPLLDGEDEAVLGVIVDRRKPSDPILVPETIYVRPRALRPHL